jgi:hypothetical protein
MMLKLLTLMIPMITAINARLARLFDSFIAYLLSHSSVILLSGRSTPGKMEGGINLVRLRASEVAAMRFALVVPNYQSCSSTDAGNVMTFRLST